MGGWAGAYPMPARYDSVACASELMPKAFVVKKVVSGWRPVEKGGAPAPPLHGWGAVLDLPVTVTDKSEALAEVTAPDGSGQVPNARFAGKFADFADLQIRDATFKEGITQVFQTSRPLARWST